MNCIRRLAAAVLLSALSACAADPGSKARGSDLRTLDRSTVREELAAAAVRIAGSGDAAALAGLGERLSDPAFLARLDDTAAPQASEANLSLVFKALAENPSKATEKLCLRILPREAYGPDGDRLLLLLPALAAVKPMSAEGAAAFASANLRGYSTGNGTLLAANGSPRAMSLLGSMFADRSIRVEDRMDMARYAVVPHRTAPAMVRMVDSLARRPGLEPGLLLALADCLFGNRPEEWYGKRRNAPAIPPWKAAAPGARREAAALGKRLLAAHPDWPAALRDSMKAVAGP